MSASNNSTTTTSPADAKQQFTDEQLQIEVPCLTKDGNKILVKNAWLLQSDLYNAMTKDLFLGVADVKLDDFEFPVKTLSTDVFQRIVEWLKERDGKPPFIIKEDPNTGVRKWFELTEFEEEFFQKLDVDELAELIVAANFLQIKSLYLCGCQAVAKLLVNNTPEQIRELFGLEDDMTQEEKAAVRARNVWALNSKSHISHQKMSAENNPTTVTSTVEEVKKQFTDDGDTILVKHGLLLQSDLYSGMAKDLRVAESKFDNFAFPVENIPTGVFELVVEWLKEHDGKPPVVVEQDPDTKERKWFDISPFEEEFFKKLELNIEQLAAVIAAANFMQINSLYLGGCQAFAKQLKEKEPEQLRELLGLQEDMTEEQKAQVRAKNVWCSY